jgi:anti-sigma regulatory factor (Ser/Thr protein kinase)
VDRVGIFYHDRAAAQLIRLVGINPEGEREYAAPAPIHVLPEHGGPLQRVARGELPYFHSHDVRVDVPDVRFVEEIRAHAIVPLVAGGEIIGAMCVDNLLSSRDISELVLQPLTLFGHFAAITLHNALRQRELAQAEAQKKQFYRDVVFSVTNGKLVLCDREQIDRYWPWPLPAGSLCAEVWEEGDVRRVREILTEAAGRIGMEEQRVYDLCLAASEGATNALKHGGGGRVGVVETEGRLRVRIEDAGAGIDPFHLPCATLMKGYSTRQSMGLGFTLMNELTDKLYLHTAPSGTVIILEMGAHPDEHAGVPAALLSNWED